MHEFWKINKNKWINFWIIYKMSFRHYKWSLPKMARAESFRSKLLREKLESFDQIQLHWPETRLSSTTGLKKYMGLNMSLTEMLDWIILLKVQNICSWIWSTFIINLLSTWEALESMFSIIFWTNLLNQLLYSPTYQELIFCQCYPNKILNL